MEKQVWSSDQEVYKQMSQIRKENYACITKGLPILKLSGISFMTLGLTIFSKYQECVRQVTVCDIFGFSLKTVLWKIAVETEVWESWRRKLGSYRIKYKIVNKKDVITNITLIYIYIFYLLFILFYKYFYLKE